VDPSIRMIAIFLFDCRDLVQALKNRCQKLAGCIPYANGALQVAGSQKPLECSLHQSLHCRSSHYEHAKPEKKRGEQTFGTNEVKNGFEDFERGTDPPRPAG
jgi:hypothetical protein